MTMAVSQKLKAPTTFAVEGAFNESVKALASYRTIGKSYHQSRHSQVPIPARRAVSLWGFNVPARQENGDNFGSGVPIPSKTRDEALALGERPDRSLVCGEDLVPLPCQGRAGNQDGSRGKGVNLWEKER